MVVDDTMMSRTVSLTGRDEFTSPIAYVKEEDEVQWVRLCGSLGLRYLCEHAPAFIFLRTPTINLGCSLLVHELTKNVRPASRAVCSVV